MERIDEIRERLNKATPGPWKYTCNGRYEDHDEAELITPYDNLEISILEDAQFIAHAPEDIKYLLERLTAMQEETAALKSERDEMEKSNQTYSEENSELYGQVAELKKALELIQQNFGYCMGNYGVQYYIQQAKEELGKS